MKNLSDKELVSKILAKDESALYEFYRANFPKVTGYVRKLIDNKEDVEEIVQDTFMASLEAFRDFTFSCSLSTYLCAIAKRKSIDYYRKKKISQFIVSKNFYLEKLLELTMTPEHDFDRKLVSQAMNQAFVKLQPRYQQLLHLKYIENLSLVQIAQKLSISFKSAESGLFRARKQFAVFYQEESSRNPCGC